MELFLPSAPQAAVWGTLVHVCVVIGASEGAFRHHRIPHSPSYFRILHTQRVCVCVVYSLMQWSCGATSPHRTTLTHTTPLITANRRIHHDPLQLLHDLHEARQKISKNRWPKGFVWSSPIRHCKTEWAGLVVDNGKSLDFKKTNRRYLPYDLFGGGARPVWYIDCSRFKGGARIV